MIPGPLLRIFVQPLEIGIELPSIHPPYAPAADLDGGEVARADQRVHLRNTHAQVGRNVFQGHETRFHARRGRLRALRRTLWRGHGGKIASYDVGSMDLVLFAPVWWPSGAP